MLAHVIPTSFFNFKNFITSYTQYICDYILYIHIVMCILLYVLWTVWSNIYHYTQLQAEKKQLMTKLKEMDQQEDELRVGICSVQWHPILVCIHIYICILYIIVNPRGPSPHYLIQYHVQVTGCNLIVLGNDIHKIFLLTFCGQFMKFIS